MCPDDRVKLRKISRSRWGRGDNTTELARKFDVSAPPTETPSSSISNFLQPTVNGIVLDGIEVRVEMAEHLTEPCFPNRVMRFRKPVHLVDHQFIDFIKNRERVVPVC